MNVKKAIKKVVALGSGLTMIGATIMGATADLGDLPSPFVQNGVAKGKIVIGANADAQDLLGAIDISASLQAAAKTGVSISGTSATTTVDGGVLVEDSNNQDFNYGDTISNTALDDQDFPDILEDGVISDDDGSDYEFQQEIVVGAASLLFGRPDNDVYDDPVIYLDLDGGSGYILNFTIDFDSGDSVDWENLDDSESLDIFGTTWTIDNIADSDDIILYGSDRTVLVELNSPIDIDVEGTTHTLNVVGANGESSPAEVHISVDGEVKSLSEGQTKTINGLQVYVQDVFVSTIGGQSASAKLFIGSKELNLGNNFGTWTEVEIDSEALEGVDVLLSGTDSAVTQIDFRIDATKMLNSETGEDYDWLALGDSFVDPLFGFEVNFVEAVPGLMDSSRDHFQFDSASDDLKISFTNNKGIEYSGIELFTFGGTNFSAGDDFVLSGTSLTDGAIFILEEDSSSAEPVSRIFEFTGTSDSDQTANFKDVGSKQTYAVSNTSAIAKTGVTATITGNDAVTLGSAVKNVIWTESGANASWVVAETNSPAFGLTIIEDAKQNNKDEITGDTFTVNISYDGTDNEVNVATPAGITGSSDTDDGSDYRYGISTYGTYYVHEAEDSTQLDLYFPPEDVDYNIFVAPPGSAVVSSGGSSGSTAYNVNPIGVGFAVLDTNAPNLGSSPMIVVGGPCVNTVAAELMGNPVDCTEGFVEGKAVIKYYAASNAILVAGYSAQDTVGASRVLAQYGDWDLSGNEVEVVVPSLSSIKVNPVA